MTPARSELQKMNIRARIGIFIVGLVVTLLSVGCAQAPAVDRDLNAEAMDQMSRWGGSPM
jgi:hypothetical protein